MPDPLSPKLTAWDERVLRVVPDDHGRRFDDIALLCGVGRGLFGTPEKMREERDRRVTDVRATLRGLEHLGYVENRSGWWRRVK